MNCGLWSGGGRRESTDQQSWLQQKIQELAGGCNYPVLAVLARTVWGGGGLSQEENKERNVRGLSGKAK